MTYAWRDADVSIPSDYNKVLWVDSSCYICGIAFTRQSDIIEWRAIAMSNGWFVEVIKNGSIRGSAQGSTFNLPLEVAAAIKRLA